MLANNPISNEDASIQPLLEKLNYTGSDELRFQAEIDQAIVALAKLGEIAALIEYFERTSLKPLQRRIIQVIGDQVDAFVLNFLIDAASHPDPQLREVAIGKLVRWFPYERVIEPLFAALGALPRQGVWYEIVSTFTQSDDPEIVRRLRSYLTSEHAAYRCAAVVALRLLNAPELVPVMLVLLRNDDDGDIRYRAAQALADAPIRGGDRHAEIVGAFIDAMDDLEYAVRSAAYYGLIRQGDPAGLAPLQARCDHLALDGKANRFELMDCLGALSALSGAEPVDYLISLLQNPDLHIGVHAVVVERLSKLAEQHPDQWAQSEAQIREVLPLLLAMLEQETHSRLHYAITRIMAALRAAEAVEPLCHMLVTRLADKLTHTLIHTLGEIGDARAVPTLIMVLGKTDLDDVVIRALKRIGTPDALAAVESYQHDTA